MEPDGGPRNRAASWPQWLYTWRADLAIAIVVAFVQFTGTYFGAGNQTDRASLDLLAYALIAVGPIALLFRRRYPVAVLLVIFAATLTYWTTDYPRGPIFFALIIAFITTIMAGHRVVAVVVALTGWAAFTWLPYLAGNEPRPGLAGTFGLLAWLLVLLAIGEVARAGRARAAETARTREEEARRRASEERLRIARELHDVLAHNISLINVQAGVALHLMDEQPEQARTALTAIKQASKDALGELRSVLEVLRRSGEAEPRTPQPGLDELDDLISRAGAAGLVVAVEVDGVPRPLPAEVDLAAFRIVQEAVTNVARHAGEATATVRVAYGAHDVTLQIDDNGRGGTPSSISGSGSGLAGMRERTAALGGRLEVGPRPGGGFRVRAELPMDGAR
jgi:signal transduction histidine kinase